MRFYLPLAFLVLSQVKPASGQSLDSLNRPEAFTPGLHGVVEAGGLISSVAQTPFWLRTNQYGIVPLGGSAGTLRAGLFRNYPAPAPADLSGRRRPRFDWGFGLSVVGNTGPVGRPETLVNDAPQLLWPELFAKVKFGQFELFGGRRREVYGLGDTTLTSGFVAWSGNAIPFPKIQLHTPNFVPVRWLGSFLSYKAGYAHGWFTQPGIQGAMLHQKHLYLRLGKPTGRLTFTAGLNHQAQWGGFANYLKGTIFSESGQLPQTLQDYVTVVLGVYPDAIANDRYTYFDGTNRIGNHVGSIDFAFDWIGNRHSWMLYHQHIYEDASGLAFRNVPDGLTGLRWVDRTPARSTGVQLKRIVLEMLVTTDQSGSVFDIGQKFQGRDNYFSHGQYRDGWSYRGRTIGTPFIAPRNTFTAAVNLNEGGGPFVNNRLVMWYAGAEAMVANKIQLMARVAWSRNFGGYDQPFSPPYTQLSAFLSGQGRLTRLPNVWLNAALAVDQGELYPKSVGGFISLQKRW